MARRVIKSPESLQIEIRIEVWLRLVYKPRDPLRDLDTVYYGCGDAEAPRVTCLSGQRKLPDVKRVIGPT
jgi:hypothetical protein